MAENKLPEKITTDVRQKNLDQAIQFLRNKRKELSRFQSAEDLVTADPLPDALGGVLHHLGVLKFALAQTLWSEQFFIGTSILDEILFEVIVDPRTADPLAAALDRIRDSGIHGAGMIIYPVHSFGVVGLGLREYFTKEKLVLDLPEAGICIAPQTNSVQGTIDFLEHALELFGISQSVPAESIIHHRRSSLEWLERNPLLAVKANSFSGYAYENQELLLIKLEICTTLIFMLSALEPVETDRSVLIGGSSSRTNNWQTLDINHYLVLEYGPPRAVSLSARRIPMNVKRTELTNACDLNVDVDPRHWHSKPGLLLRLINALTRLESGFTRCSVRPQDNSVEARVYRKFYDALGYFRRSFHSRSRRGEPAVFLATAFEMLLTDSYSSGVKTRLCRRFDLATNAEADAKNLTPIVESLYDRRSETVHQGRIDGTLNLSLHSAV